MWFLFLLVFALDRLTKYLVVKNIPLNQSLPVIKNIFHISLVHNTGAAFGLLKNQNYLFMAVSLLAVILIAIHLKRRTSLNKAFAFSLVLILAGTVGNLIDRVFFGYVIDFLDFRIWPVFNLADSSITVGAILLGYCLLKNPVARNY